MNPKKEKLQPNYLYTPEEVAKLELQDDSLFFGITGSFSAIQAVVQELAERLDWVDTPEQRKKHPVPCIEGEIWGNEKVITYLPVDSEGNVCATITVLFYEGCEDQKEAYCFVSKFAMNPYGFSNTYN